VARLRKTQRGHSAILPREGPRPLSHLSHNEATNSEIAVVRVPLGLAFDFSAHRRAAIEATRLGHPETKVPLCVAGFSATT
jgi:hypothetical protein